MTHCCCPRALLDSQVFDEFDRDRSGQLDRRELQQGLKHLDINLSANEIDELMEQFGVDPSRGQISYIDFEDFVLNEDLPGRVSPIQSPSSRTGASRRFNTSY